MIDDRLRRQIAFILETDRLKQVIRRTYILPDPRTGESRNENSAEHSWQLALMALLLAEHANQPVDPVHVAKMVLIHDIVEVDAGDTFCYDVTANLDKNEREQQAATRLFGLLPEDQGGELRALWEEFEARQTPAAKFANALDRFMPTLHNFHNQGGSWRDHGVTLDRVRVRLAPIAAGSQALAEVVDELLAAAVAAGLLAPVPEAAP